MSYPIEFDDHLGVIQAHIAWKEKFAAVVTMRSPDLLLEMLSDRSCYLKRWLTVEAKEIFGGTVAYEKCLDAYFRFHDEAVEISNLVCDGDFVAAENRAISGVSFTGASRDLVVAIAFMFLGNFS